jgi:hypothetical protein
MERRIGHSVLHEQLFQWAALRSVIYNERTAPPSHLIREEENGKRTMRIYQPAWHQPNSILLQRPRTRKTCEDQPSDEQSYCFFFPALFFSPSFLSISIISFSSALFAYHCPACNTNTPTSTSAKIVLLAAYTLSVSSLLI